MTTFIGLGKKFRQILNDGYIHGSCKLTLKTKTPSNVEFITKGFLDNNTGDLYGNIDSKFALDDYGVTVVDTWKGKSSVNSLATEIGMHDVFMDGVNVVLCGDYVPKGEDKDVAIKTEYVDDALGVNFDLLTLISNPVVSLAAAYQINSELIVGGRINSEKNNDIGVQYTTGDMCLHLNLNNLKGLTLSLATALESNIELGALIGYEQESERKSVIGDGILAEIGVKCDLAENQTLSVKLSSEKYAAVGYSNQINETFGIILSYKLDLDDMDNYASSLGVGLSVEL